MSEIHNLFVQENAKDLQNYCTYCNRYFRFKDLFDQHVVTCEYFYRSRRQKDRDIDLQEILPSGQEQYKLVQHLLNRIVKMEKEIIQLKGSVSTRKRKVVMQWLNSPACPKPTAIFNDWIKTIPISEADLQRVFDGDLAEGMKHCLANYFDENNQACLIPPVSLIPLRAFTQKQGIIYIWTSDQNGNKWTAMTPEMFERLTNRLAHRFLQEYLKWQMANSERISSNEQDKERNIDYMRKINGSGKAHEDRRYSDLRKWLYNKLAKDFTDLLVEYDVV